MGTVSCCLSEKAQCPSCGAELVVEAAGLVQCQFCGTTSFVDPARTVLSRIVYARLKSAVLPEAVSSFLGEKYNRRLNWRRHYYPFWLFNHNGRQQVLPASDLAQPLPVGDLVANSLQQKNCSCDNPAPEEIVLPEFDLSTALARYGIENSPPEGAVLLQLPYYEVQINYRGREFQLAVDGLTGEIWSQDGLTGQPRLQWGLTAVCGFSALSGCGLLAAWLPFWGAVSAGGLLVAALTLLYKKLRD